MEIITAKRLIMLKQWSEMIHARRESGMTVNAWCQENGINEKTYYYRLKRLRVESLKDPSLGAKLLPCGSTPAPVFTKINLSSGTQARCSGSAVTVRFGKAMIDIHNGADPDIIASTLRVLNEIC